MNRFTFNMAKAKEVYLIIDDVKVPVSLNTVTSDGLLSSDVIFEGRIKYGTLLYKNMDMRKPVIKKVIFSGPATIVFWKDGTKTVVKCQDEEFDPEKGIAMAFVKKCYGDDYKYADVIKPWVEKYYAEHPSLTWDSIGEATFKRMTNSIFGAYGQFKPKFTPYVGDPEDKKKVEALKKEFEFLNKVITDLLYSPIPIQPSCYDDDKYKKALAYFEENMKNGPCDIPYCEDCGAQLVAIEAIRRCLEKDKKEKENDR